MYFLQVECHGFRLADVFHGFRHGDAGFLADMEKAVYRRARRENNGRMCQYLDPLGTELLQGYAHDTYKRFIGDLYVVFLGQFVERGLLYNCGPRLRNQYFFNFQC